MLLVAGGLGFRLIGARSGGHHPHPRHSVSAALSLPLRPILPGPPLASGQAASAVLFLGGQDLRRVAIEPQRPSSAAAPVAASTGLPLGPGPAVQQIVPVSGGVVALLTGHGSGGLRDIGAVIFVPADPAGTAGPRVIARANYIAAAPDGASVWVEQAGHPWGNGPAGSPAWRVDLSGHRLSGTLMLGQAVLSGMTSHGVLAAAPPQLVSIDAARATRRPNRTLIISADGTRRAARIPTSVQILGTDADHVAWQELSCHGGCPLWVTDLRTGIPAAYPLPPRTSIDSADNLSFGPGDRFALALDTLSRDGVATGTDVYVTDPATRTFSRVPGSRTGLPREPAVIGALPQGSTDVISLGWAAAGPGLWMVASDGLSYQIGYWSGTGSLRVLPVQPGLASKLAIAGSPAVP